MSDLSVSDQLEIYELAKKVKGDILSKTTNFAKMDDPERTTYLVFMEDSTRTKESFRNAALFHGGKVNVFDCSTSSFNKHETITDTIKMLCGYSTGPVTFVIRSRLEGVCRWLSKAITSFALKNSLPPVNFINAGDGRHEHPSQELLDEFSFLEQLSFDRSSIHIALIGDLLNGRTIHSKIDGLKIYDHVIIDLVAPQLISLPNHYMLRMKNAGFHVNSFASLDEYLDTPSKANIFYFTRLQLERMSDSALEKEDDLRAAITFRDDMRARLRSGTKFYHPLPRNGKYPEIPFTVDDSDLNGWDTQSRNGYFVRIALLSFLNSLSEHKESHRLVEDRRCSNHDCISNPRNGQREVISSHVATEHGLLCYYCDQPLADVSIRDLKH